MGLEGRAGHGKAGQGMQGRVRAGHNTTGQGMGGQGRAEQGRGQGTALVSARIDYCNSLLYGTSKSNIDKLQRLQNSLTRAVMCTSKFESITPVLAALHWLPIKARITYKVALLKRKVLTTQQPGYLSSLIRVNEPTRQLRPSTHRVLRSTAPRTAFESRAF